MLLISLWIDSTNKTDSRGKSIPSPIASVNDEAGMLSLVKH